MSDVFTKGPIELRLGDYREVLADVEPDAVIVDPPYSDRTHDGARSANCFRTNDKRTNRIQSILQYDRIGSEWCRQFAQLWAPRTADWSIVFGDHISNRWWEESFREVEWLTFAPIPWIRTNAPPRFQGDGPQNSCEWLAVARPRRTVRNKGSRVGYYTCAIEACSQLVIGGKPRALMRALVRDYSEPGDLICDPCAGGATTLIAAALEGRRSIGAELDPDTYAKACARIERTALTSPLPFTERAPMDGEQEGLFDGPT